MGRQQISHVRVTAVLDFIDSSWYKWWLKDLAKKTDKPVEEAERIGKESAEFGTKVHALVEDHLRGKWRVDSYTPRQRECAGYLIQWMTEVGATPWVINGVPCIEYTVQSELHKYVGHLDAILNIGGTPWMVDFKTTSEIRKVAPLQKAAYAQALSEQHGLEVDYGVTLRIDRDPSVKKQFQVKPYSGLRTKYLKGWLFCLGAYNYFHNRGDFKIIKKGK
jgi:hypothetical protein